MFFFLVWNKTKNVGLTILKFWNSENGKSCECYEVCQLENENASISSFKWKKIIHIYIYMYSKDSIEFLKPQGKRKLNNRWDFNWQELIHDLFAN
jgi:hypothetical protein